MKFKRNFKNQKISVQAYLLISVGATREDGGKILLK